MVIRVHAITSSILHRLSHVLSALVGLAPRVIENKAIEGPWRPLRVSFTCTDCLWVLQVYGVPRIIRSKKPKDNTWRFLWVIQSFDPPIRGSPVLTLCGSCNEPVRQGSRKIQHESLCQSQQSHSPIRNNAAQTKRERVIKLQWIKSPQENRILLEMWRMDRKHRKRRVAAKRECPLHVPHLAATTLTTNSCLFTCQKNL